MAELNDGRVGHPQVHCGISRTVNLGNYESIKIDLGVTDYQQPGETISEAHERVFNFVARRMKSKMEAVEESLREDEVKGGY